MKSCNFIFLILFLYHSYVQASYSQLSSIDADWHKAMQNPAFKKQEWENCVSHFKACQNEIDRRSQLKNLSHDEKLAFAIWSMKLKNSCLVKTGNKTTEQYNQDVKGVTTIFSCSRTRRMQIVDQEFQAAWDNSLDQVNQAEQEAKFFKKV